MNRLSDEDETRLTMALGSSGEHHREARPRATCGCAATRAAVSPSWASRAPRRASRTAAGSPPGCCGPGEGYRSGTGPGRPGTGAASPPRICATSCSTAACSWTRSRPPPAGRTSAKLHGAVREALRASLAGRGTQAARHVPRIAPVSVGRIPVLHLPGPPGGRRARPVAGGEDRRVRGDLGQRRHDHPPPRDRPRPPPLAGGRGRRARHRGAARRQAAPRPRRDHEPREAPPAD